MESHFKTIADLGEKRLIAEIIRPLFDSGGSAQLLGDDCAFWTPPAGSDVLLTTDRVPADLIAFKHGLINHYELGSYLANLNLSDIAACGGIPTGLLLNMGLPAHLKLEDFVAICEGVKAAAARVGGSVQGGDISSASELSLSATCFGYVPTGTALKRKGARPGDWIFVTRPIGLTPAAFAYYLRLRADRIALTSTSDFRRQFTHMYPLVQLATQLRESGDCTSCMDNTDGLAQSLSELAHESGLAFVVDKSSVDIPPSVAEVARAVSMDSFQLAMGPGADFSLVGTIKPNGSIFRNVILSDGCILSRIGYAEAGKGLFLKDGENTAELLIKGWDYFASEIHR